MKQQKTLDDKPALIYEVYKPKNKIKKSKPWHESDKRKHRYFPGLKIHG